MSRRHPTRYTNNNNPTGRGLKSGYEAPLVHEFVSQRITTEISTRNAMRIKFLNGKRMSADDQRRHLIWAEQEQVSLAVVDSYLTRYSLMTWELEDWCERNHGRSGYFEASVPVS